MVRQRAIPRLGAALLAALAAAALGCGRPPVPEAGVARPAGPPPGYEEETVRSRMRKDEGFRTGQGSPLPEALKASFPGLEYYPVDPAWRFVGTPGTYEDPEPFTIIGTEGERRPTERWGRFDFDVDGTVHTLQVYRLLAEPGTPLFLPFADDTTGRDTYPAGRYVDPVVGEDGRLIVDFNRAYYPFCAYGKPYDCPITPAENRLDVAITAGERGSWTGRVPRGTGPGPAEPPLAEASRGERERVAVRSARSKLDR